MNGSMVDWKDANFHVASQRHSLTAPGAFEGCAHTDSEEQGTVPVFRLEHGTCAA
jgi:hypothetical protein